MFRVQYFRECIYIGEPLLDGFSGYRVPFGRSRTVPYKRAALYYVQQCFAGLEFGHKQVSDICKASEY